MTYGGSTYDALTTIQPGGGTPDQNSNWTLLAKVGDRGAQGQQGLQGDQGPAGPQGPQGDQGPAGQNGTNGTNGQGFTFRTAFDNGTNYNAYDVVTYNGSTYDASISIPAGGGTPDQNSNWALMAKVGDRGAQGQQGAQGDQGPAGPQGAAGAQGPMGPAGPQGLQGDQGPAGQNGTNGTNGQGFTFRDAFDSGTNYSAYDVVTYSNSTYVAKVTIPAGGGPPDQNSNWSLVAKKGDQGLAGPQGPQGEQGAIGPQGAQGPQGEPGNLNPGSPYYIQNGTSVQASSNFNISGAGTVGGTIAANAVNSTTTYQIGGTQMLAYPGNHTVLVGPVRTSTGLSNTAVGDHAGNTGNSNTAIGYLAGLPSGGNDNILMGYFAGAGPFAQGSQNTLIGSQSGWSLGQADNNTFVGFNTGGSAVSVHDNIFLGSNAGANLSAGSSNIYLGNAGNDGENNVIRIGTPGTDNGQQNSVYIAGITSRTVNGSPVLVDAGGMLGIGTVTGYIDNSTTLQTAASFNIDGSASVGTSYKIGGTDVLSADASNNIVKVGLSAGTNNTGAQNTFLGNTAGVNSTGGQSTYVGFGAGNAYNGRYSVFVGFNSGNFTESGDENTFVGAESGPAFVSGSQNTFVGRNAGSKNATDGNTVVGYNAGINGSYNLLLGYQAGQNAKVGDVANSNIYLMNAGQSAEENTIRIGTDGTAAGQQTQTFIAGIFGDTISGKPVVVNSNGQLGVSDGSGVVTSFNGRTGTVVPAANDYSFSLLSGTVADGQLGGSYTHPITFSSPVNSFTGDGSGLMNVPMTPGSPAYIQNGTSQQASANFNISGSGTAGQFNSTGTYQIGGQDFVKPVSSNAGVAVGFGAGNTASTGSANVFVGDSAGSANTSGVNNTFIGANTGNANTSGGFNTFLGGGAGAQNTTGTNSTYVGVNAGAFSSGDHNVFLGANAGQAINAGVRNIVIGADSGNHGEDGSDNIWIGYGINTVETSTIRIGSITNPQTRAFIGGVSGTTVSGGSFVVIDSSGQLGTSGSAGSIVTSFKGRTGAVTPAANDYSFSLLSGTLGSSQFTGTYGSTVALSNSSNSFTGNGSGLTNITASGLAAGTYANALNFTNASNSLTGSFTGNGSGLTNVPVGSGSSFYIQNGTALQAGSNFNISGSGTASTFNTPGTYQIGGGTVLNANINSVAVGISAGSIAAASNTFVGAFAGNVSSGTGNAYIGHAAGKLATGAANNTIVGADAATAITDGGGNTILGQAAGTGIVGGFNNIFIGIGAGSAIGSNGTDNIEIGTAGASSDSFNIRIGDPSISYSAAYMQGIALNGSPGGSAVFVNNAGKLGVNTSSQRFKENILDMNESSSKIFDLRPVTFFYKPAYDDGSHSLQYGLIAEEVAKIYPELVIYEKSGRPFSVKYQFLAPMLLNELQKQHKIVAEQQTIIRGERDEMVSQREELTSQKQQISTQQQQIQSQQGQIAELQQRLSRLESLFPQTPGITQRK